MSVLPPGAKPTINVTGAVGQLWDSAHGAQERPRTDKTINVLFFIMVKLPKVRVKAKFRLKSW
jgi:hypothetical protein